MFTLTVHADEPGVAVLAAGARTAMAVESGEGEGAGLAVRQLAADARRRLRGGEEDTTLRLEGEVRGTEFVVTLHDFGEPVSGPPDGVLALLESGILTAAEARTDGAGNVSEIRLALPKHNVMLDADTVEVIPEDAERTAEEVTIREITPDDSAALTRAFYRCYGWSYPNPTLYYPDRIAASLESGERIGFVAMTESGEVAAHWGAVFLSPTVVETGATITDPRFRGRGLAKALGQQLLDRLHELGVTGRLREPVLTHPATQKIAIEEGATIIGAYINMTHPIQQVGITDGVQAIRGSLSVAYGALRPWEPATMWIPGPYEPMVRRVLSASDWPRELAPVRRDPDLPDRSVLSTSFNSDNRFGLVDVTVAGADLVNEVQTALGQMQRSGAEYVQVRLPANQPALATVAAGLPELGLGYASVIPAFRPAPGDPGDILVTQWIADLDIDPSSWVFANDDVRALVLDIVGQIRDVGSRGSTRQRRAAQRAQLYAALGE